MKTKILADFQTCISVPLTFTKEIIHKTLHFLMLHPAFLIFLCIQKKKWLDTVCDELFTEFDNVKGNEWS